MMPEPIQAFFEHLMTDTWLFDFSIAYDYFKLYLGGMWTTTWLVALSLLFGMLIAIPTALARISTQKWINFPMWCYSFFFRGTPLLIQLYLIYYGLSQFIDVGGTLWAKAWFCTLVAFALNTGAYTAEIIAGSIKEVNKGEIEAAKAYGMNQWQIYTRLIFPSAMRQALPAYSNEVVFMLHGSAVAGIVTIMDLTGVARQVNAKTYAPIEAFLTAGLFYMVLSMILIGCFKLAEDRYLAYRKPIS